MEKINVIPRLSTDAVAANGSKYKKVETTDGLKFNLFDGDLIKLWEDNFGKVVELELEDKGKFKNIKGIKEGGVAKTETPLTSLNDDRNKSIIAQCLVKAVLGQVDSKVEIEEAVEMYKKAYSLI